MFGLLDVESGDDLVLEDLLVVVNIVEKQVERDDALGEARFQMFPFVGRQHPRDRIERKDPLGAAVIVIDIEGDALAQEVEFGVRLAGEEVGVVEMAEFPQQRGAMAPHSSIRAEHLIVKISGIIALEHFHGVPDA